MIDEMLTSILKPFAIEHALKTRNKELFMTVMSPSWKSCLEEEPETDGITRFNTQKVMERKPFLTPYLAKEHIRYLHETTTMESRPESVELKIKHYIKTKLNNLPYATLLTLLGDEKIKNKLYLQYSGEYLNCVLEVSRNIVRVNGTDMYSKWDERDKLFQTIEYWKEKAEVIHLILK